MTVRFGEVLLFLFLAITIRGQQGVGRPQSTGGDSLLTMDVEDLFRLKVVTASKFSELAVDAPGVISVVSKEELRRFGGLTLAEVLGRVGGLSVSSSYLADRSIIAARGDLTSLTSGHILYLINGRPSREVQVGGVTSDLLESFPLSALERIEVIRGPGSVLYGSNAFTAVVNLITSRNQASAMRINAFGTRPGGGGASGRVSLNKGDLRIFAAAQSHRRPDWRVDYRLPESILRDPLAVNPVLLQRPVLRDAGIGSFAEISYRRVTFMTSFTQWKAPTFVRATVGEGTWRRQFGDLGYEFTVRKNWTAAVNLTYTRNTFLTPDFPFVSRRSHELVLEFTNTVLLGGKDRLTFGALGNRIEGRELYQPPGLSIPISAGSRLGSAIYGQLDHDLASGLKVVGGVQINKIAKIAINTVPRVGLVWTPVYRITVKSLYAKAFRAPSLNETLIHHPAFSGNPDLVPEQVGTVDLSVSYGTPRFQSAISVFRSHFSNRISIDASQIPWKYQNRGQATFRGAEWETKLDAGRHILLTGAIQRQANRDDSGRRDVTPIPSFEVKGGVSYAMDIGLDLSVFEVYRPGVRNAGAIVNPPSGANHLATAEVRFNLGKRVHPGRREAWYLYARGDNLANRAVWLPAWGGTNETIPFQRGRTIYFGLEVSSGQE
jgi:outer membrane receptor protein involved in Fe transport